MPIRKTSKRATAKAAKRKRTTKPKPKPASRRVSAPKVSFAPRQKAERAPLNADPHAPRDSTVWRGLDVRRASAKGLGLFATAPWLPGQLIATVQGLAQSFEYDDEPAWGETWFGVAPGKWVEPFPNTPPAFVNHS